MKANPFARNRGEGHRGFSEASDVGSKQQSPGRAAPAGGQGMASSGNRLHMQGMMGSPVHMLQMQRSVGNRAAGAVMQRMIDSSDGQKLDIAWDTLTGEDAQKILFLIQQGIWVAEEGDMDKLNQILTGLQAEPQQQNGMVLEEDSDGVPPESGFKQSFGMDLDDEMSDGSDSDYEEEPDPGMLELYAMIEPELKAKVEKSGRKIPGKKVQGDFLERYVSTYAEDLDVHEKDANAFYMNIPGIDHLVDNETHPFIQDKMHLSVSTANVDTYRRHYFARSTMAANLLKAMVEPGKRGTSIRSLFESALCDDEWIHKDAVQHILQKVNEFRENYQHAMDDDTESSLPDILDDDELITYVSNRIAFTVPRDIWELLHQAKLRGEVGDQEMRAYIRLDLDTADFLKLYDMLGHVARPWNERKPNKDDDEYKVGEV